jgi:acetate kinase
VSCRFRALCGTRQKKLDVTQLEKLVDHRSGLLGISGLSAGLRDLQKAQSASADARLAIDTFCYSASKQIAAMSAVLGGGQLLVFTGGIGENDAEVRAGICGRLASIGVLLDESRNRAGSDTISDKGSGFRYAWRTRRSSTKRGRYADAPFPAALPTSPSAFSGVGLRGLSYGHCTVQLLLSQMASVRSDFPLAGRCNLRTA